MLDADGAYSGEQCSSTEHEYHHSKLDNVFKQTEYQGLFFNRMRENGVSIIIMSIQYAHTYPLVHQSPAAITTTTGGMVCQSISIVSSRDC